MTQPDFIGMKFLLIPLNIQTSSLVDLMAAQQKIKEEDVKKHSSSFKVHVPPFI
jgi:hypothetical protein